MAELRWVPIASVFPAGLDTQTDPTDLRDGFTPEAYGMDIDYPGRLVKASSVPTGSAPVTKTRVIGSDTWTEHFRRLWLIDGVDLRFLAPEMTSTALEQGIARVPFTADANAILKFFPVGNDLYVGKLTGGYYIPRANSLRGSFSAGDIEESMKISAKENAAGYNRKAYASNDNGLMAWDGGSVEEITSSVHDSEGGGAILGHFKNKALTIDFQKQRVVGTDSFVYDIRTESLFDYVPTGFRFTTRTLRDTDYSPFSVKKVQFWFENTTKRNGAIKFQVQRDKRDWRDVRSLPIRWDSKRTRASVNLYGPTPQAVKFRLRVTDVSSHIHIKQIDAETAIRTSQESPSE